MNLLASRQAAPEPQPGLDGRRSRFTEWLPELLFVVVSSMVGIWAGGRWLDPVGDPGFSWSLAYRLAEGDVLYRDVYLAYGPLSPYLLAGLGHLFRFSAGWIIVSNWVAAIIAGVLLLRCGRPFLTTLERIALAGMILAFSLWVPGAGRLILPYTPQVVHGLILSLAALLVVASPRLAEQTRLWLAGLMAGLAFSTKQEIGLAAVIALLAPCLLLRPRAALFRGSRILIPFLAVVAMGAVFCLSSAPFDVLRDRNHAWPFDLIPPAGWNRALRGAAGMIPADWFFDLRNNAWQLLVEIGLLASIGLLVSRERTFSRWVPVLVLAVALVCWWMVEGFRFTSRGPVNLSATIAFLVGALAIVQPARENRRQLLAIGVFAGLAGLRAVFSPSLSAHFDGPAHFATSLTWILFLCALAPGIFAPAPRAARFTRRLTAVLLIVLTWGGIREGAESLRPSWREPVETPRGTVFLDHQKAGFYRSLSRELEPGEKVLVLPEINAIDVIFSVRSVSPVLFHVPGWIDPPFENALIQRIEADPPDAVIVFDRPLAEFGVARLGEGYGDELLAWVHRNYEPAFTKRAGGLFRRTTPRPER